MSEKKFSLCDKRILDEGVPLSYKTVCDRLNAFQELSINDLKRIEELKKENEKLKKQQEVIQKTTLFNCIQQGVSLKGKYDNLKEAYKELLKENRHLEAWSKSLQSVIVASGEYLKAYDEILTAFIKGIESEKGIDPTNEEFQEKMDFALSYLKRLKKEFENVDEYLEKKELSG